MRVCRDLDDDVVIETAINGRADAVVTRDDDLQGATEIAAFLGERGIAMLIVHRSLAAIEAGSGPACRRAPVAMLASW